MFCDIGTVKNNFQQIKDAIFCYIVSNGDSHISYEQRQA